MRRIHAIFTAAAAAMAFSAVAQAVPFVETEANDTKAAANLIVGMTAGDTITGSSTGSSTTVAGIGSADYYLITKVTNSAPGIYRNRLVLTSATAGHIGTIRGLNQTDLGPGIGGAPAPGTDAILQTTSTTTTPPRFNQWYSFGRPSDMYYRVHGVVGSTAPYTATMETVPVTPTVIGTYAPGQIVINAKDQGHTTDTDMWVYDSNFVAIPGYGNDDNSIAGGGTGAGLEARLQRNYAPGTYYIAMSTFAFSNNLPAAGDDDFRTGALMDFPDKALNNSTSTTANMTFTISDSLGTTLQVPNIHAGAFDINWFCFTVAVPEPTSLGLAGVAGLGLLARRRRA